MPWQLREAIAAFKDALAIDEDYHKARLNLRRGVRRREPDR